MHTTEQYTIDGMQPLSMERPSSVAAVGDLLSEAQGDGRAVAPVGGGGALTLGNPIERYDLALDMSGLDRILEHHPTDLVLSVEAGVRLADISETLARHGQWLPIEAPYPERATIGGLVATALSGPGRAAHGSLRDGLIGIAVAGPGGGIAKAGGMVVKNVSGFDMMRLHHGALGTLGVIVSANFKVLPKPRSEATVLVAVDDLTAGFVALTRARRHSEPPSAAVIERRETGLTMAVRFDGRSTRVNGAATSLTESIGSGSRSLAEDESRAWWRGSIDRLAAVGENSCESSIDMRFGCSPMATPALAATLESCIDAHDISVELLTTWPDLGSIIVRWTASDDEDGSAAVDALAAAADDSGATWCIAGAPVGIKRGRDVWGRPPAALDTIRRLKEEFDPRRTLNPGRFCGHL